MGPPIGSHGSRIIVKIDGLLANQGRVCMRVVCNRPPTPIHARYSGCYVVTPLIIYRAGALGPAPALFNGNFVHNNAQNYLLKASLVKKLYQETLNFGPEGQNTQYFNRRLKLRASNLRLLALGSGTRHGTNY